jgi:hypothetical protein
VGATDCNSWGGFKGKNLTNTRLLQPGNTGKRNLLLFYNLGF